MKSLLLGTLGLILFLNHRKKLFITVELVGMKVGKNMLQYLMI